jgi:hypothetical protein
MVANNNEKLNFIKYKTALLDALLQLHQIYLSETEVDFTLVVDHADELVLTYSNSEGVAGAIALAKQVEEIENER